MSNNETQINVEVLRSLWPSLSTAARFYADQLIRDPQNATVPDGLSNQAAQAIVRAAQSASLEDVNVQQLRESGVVLQLAGQQPTPELQAVGENEDMFRVQAETPRVQPPLAPNVTPADAQDRSPQRQRFSDRAAGPANLSSGNAPRMGGRTRKTPEPQGAGGPVAEPFGIDLNDPTTYTIGDDGRIYPRQGFDVFASEAPLTSEERLAADVERFREEQALRTMPSRPRRLRVTPSAEDQAKFISGIRTTLADGTIEGIKYDTLSELQSQYYQSMSVSQFWQYVNDLESTALRLVQDSENFRAADMLVRYNMLEDFDGEFDFRNEYSWTQLMNLPLTFSQEQTAWWNAKFETLGLYDRYGVNPPQYVTDNQDANFGSVWKQLNAEAVGRGKTIQNIFDEFAEEQIGEIERIMADFDDYNIATTLDKISMSYRDKPLTASEFRAIKDAISMFDSEITEEEIKSGLMKSLYDLQRPMSFASQTEAYGTFTREAERELKRYFEDKNDPRMTWGKARRLFDQPFSFLDYSTSAQAPDITATPAVMEESLAAPNIASLANGSEDQ